MRISKLQTPKMGEKSFGEICSGGVRCDNKSEQQQRDYLPYYSHCAATSAAALAAHYGPIDRKKNWSKGKSNIFWGRIMRPRHVTLPRDNWLRKRPRIYQNLYASTLDNMGKDRNLFVYIGIDYSAQKRL